MTLCKLAFLVGLASLAGLADAQNETFVQVGNALCDLEVPHVIHQVCQPVTFPIEFGEKPIMTVAFSKLSLRPGLITVTVSVPEANITTKGFTPVISEAVKIDTPQTNGGIRRMPTTITPVVYRPHQEAETDQSGNRFTVSWVAIGRARKTQHRAK